MEESGILVGHSYGGYLIRLFAQRHPEQVAGMVFVDPSMERFDTELKKLDAAKVAQDQKYLDSLTPAPLKAESKLVDDAFAAASLLPAPRLPSSDLFEAPSSLALVVSAKK